MTDTERIAELERANVKLQEWLVETWKCVGTLFILSTDDEAKKIFYALDRKLRANKIIGPK